MKKTIYLLNIGDYLPEVTALTYPLIERYAAKIGAEVVKITERKYPDFAVVYEKLQIYEIEKTRQSDWIIYIDSDTLVHPDLFDLTALIPRGTVFQKGRDFSLFRFRPNELFIEDGRFIGTCNWFTVFSRECIELFNPNIGMTAEEIYAECSPTQAESFYFDRTHLVDDYVLTTNLAKHDFPYMTMADLFEKHPYSHGEYLYHTHMDSAAKKLDNIMVHHAAWTVVNHREPQPVSRQERRHGKKK